MIKHIVMWRLRDFAEGATKRENAQKLRMKLNSLQISIAEIEKLEVGVNINETDAAYDVVLYSEFADAQALATYQNHPEHKTLIADFLNKVRIEKAVVDYQTDA